MYYIFTYSLLVFCYIRYILRKFIREFTKVNLAIVRSHLDLVRKAYRIFFEPPTFPGIKNRTSPSRIAWS